MGEKSIDLGGAHIPGMPLAVEEDEAANPVDEGFLGTNAVVADATGVADQVDQLGLVRSKNGRNSIIEDRLGDHDVSSLRVSGSEHILFARGLQGD